MYTAALRRFLAPRTLAAGLLCLLTSSCSSCHVLSFWHPRDLPRGSALEHASSSVDFPKENVRSYVDQHGIPHIFANTQNDAAYAQGFYHAKDRLWQIVSNRAGIFGRLTEILGADFLDQDRSARLLVYNVEAQYEALEQRDKDLLEAYADGVNDGAAYAGDSVEMTILGVEFEKFKAIHGMAIVRFFGWNLSSGYDEELARVRIAARIDVDDPLYNELLTSVDTLGVPVVRNEDHAGLWGYGEPPGAGDSSGMGLPPAPPPPPYLPKRTKSHPSKGEKPSTKSELAQQLAQQMLGQGASNVWGVSGEHTTHGHAVLSHDPHLSHSFPGLFYLTHLEGPDFMMAGASVPGIPGVLLGHGRHVVWGTPVSNIDTQDMVRIEQFEDREDLYVLDGEPTAYGTVTQTFKIGSEDDAPVFEEEWRTTVFGPLLPPAFDYLTDQGDTFAFMWPGHDPLNQSGRIVTALWDLAAAENVDEATAAIQHLTSPAITMGMALDDGTIAYRLSGDAPVRASDEPVWWPRDGRFSDAGWTTFLPPEYKPQITNPARGFFVAANQRVVEADGPQANIIGQEGALPFRAARITEALEELIKDGRKASTDEIVMIQQDITSIEARTLAPIFGTYCPERIDGLDNDVVAAWRDALREFDGVFDVDSRGALVYTRLERDLRRTIMTLHLGEEVGEQVEGKTFIGTNLFRAYQDYDAGGEPALFDDPDTERYEGLEYFITEASAQALPPLIDQLGADPEQWRWGATHQLSAKGALASIPVLGALFTNPSLEEPGCRSCPRAEAGRRSTDDDITNGAVIRIRAEMSSPPDVRLIVDTGQSGHFGHKHSYDLHPFWRAGHTVKVAVPEDEVKENPEGQVVFYPRTVPEPLPAPE